MYYFFIECISNDKIIFIGMSYITCIIHYGGKLKHIPSIGYVGSVCEEFKEFDTDLISVTHLCSYIKKKGYSEPYWFLCKFLEDHFDDVKDFWWDHHVRDLFKLLHGKTNVVLQVYTLHMADIGDKSDMLAEKLSDDMMRMISYRRDNVVLEHGVVTESLLESGLDSDGGILTRSSCEKIKVKRDKGQHSGGNKEKSKDRGKKVHFVNDNIDLTLEGCDFQDSENENPDLFIEDIGVHEDFDSDYVGSDTLLTPSASDEEDGEHKKKYPEFNQFIDMQKKIKLEVGMKFSNQKVFRDAVRQYGIEYGIDFSWVKNESKRITIKCKKECGWRMHASHNEEENCFQIKTWKNIEHEDCGWSNKNTNATAKWLSLKYQDQIRDHKGKWENEAFINQVARDHKIFVSRFQVYRANKIAMEKLQGSHAAQYGLLWNYCEAVRLYNPGSTMKLELEDHRFQRLYVCLDALKKGLKFCRPMIHLDGCFLKAGYGGQLLVAVGRDGNDNIFPIAYAAVEAELKDSWQWFLDLLLKDIGPIAEHHWVFMSDKQKGLKEVLEEMGVEHRFCVRHMYANFNLLFKGQALKDLLWNAARATTETYFLRQIAEIKKLNHEAASWLEERNPKTWSMHKFTPNAKCGALQNNIAESFNSAILPARDKPIITMMETIRRMLMKRFAAKKEGMIKYNGVICPRIQAKLEKSKEGAVLCISHMNGNGKFEVDTFSGSKKVVDLVARTCSCRLWDLTGVPCAHAVSAIYAQRELPEEYVSNYYRKDTFLASYGFTINPMVSYEEWPQCDYEPILPPIRRAQVGRPKKARKRAADEQKGTNKVSKSGNKQRCGNCYQRGHKSRRCLELENPNKRIYKRKNKSAAGVSPNENASGSTVGNGLGPANSAVLTPATVSVHSSQTQAIPKARAPKRQKSSLKLGGSTQ